MKTIIFDGSNKNDNLLKPVIDIIFNELKSIKSIVKKIVLHEKEIAPCNGCFKCWVKTPGICIINDYGRSITEVSIKSDLLIYISPIVFGGYSSELKKYMDRIIPTVLPFFKKINGEIHHSLRYDRYPQILTIGVLSEPDKILENIFLKLVNRNAINMHNNSPNCLVIDTKNPDLIYKKINYIFKRIIYYEK